MLLQWLFSLLALITRTVLADLEGDNVCSRRETYTVTLPVWVKEPVQVKTYTWCLGVPPRCTKYRTEMRDKLKIQTAVRERVVMVCCRGYAPDRNETHCNPVCKEGGCLHGLCVSPDTCRCAAGYMGARCDSECGNGSWGVDCIQPCLCKNGAHCNHVTGDCKCEPGWRGTTCDTPCPRGTYGDACMEECQCTSRECDHITGMCYHKTPLYVEERTTATTTSVPLTSVDNVPWLKNDNITNIGDELRPTAAQEQSDKTTVSANLEIKSKEDEEVQSDITDTTKISSETTAVTEESEEQTYEESDSSKHTTEHENESTQATNGDVITNEGEHISDAEGVEGEKEENMSIEDNEEENADHRWTDHSSNIHTDSDHDEISGHEEDDHETIRGIFNTGNKQGSDQDVQEQSPPEVIYVSDGLQGSSGDPGTLGLVFSVSIGGGMALAVIIMAAGVIFTVARRRRSGKQNLQGASSTSSSSVPAAIHYSSDTSTLPLPQLFLGPEYQNGDMPLHTLRDSEPPRFGEATLTTFGHPNQLSQDEHRATRAFLELQYDIPPSAIATKNYSILPGDEPEHVYDEIPAWRNAGEC